MDKSAGIIIVGAGWLPIAIYFALGIWFPKFREPWKPNGFARGRATSAGFALFLGNLSFLGVTYYVRAIVPFRIYLILLALAGWNLAAFGFLLDRRSILKKMEADPVKFKDVQVGPSPWPALVFGILFFLVALWFFLFHPE